MGIALAIGIDIDGTLSRYADVLIPLARAVRAAGGRVFIITGLGEPEARQRLAEIAAANGGSDFYDALFSSAHYNAREIALIPLVASNEIVVGHFKQRLCRDLGVGIMFDDRADIHQWCGDVPVFDVRQARK